MKEYYYETPANCADLIRLLKEPSDQDQQCLLRPVRLITRAFMVSNHFDLSCKFNEIFADKISMISCLTAKSENRMFVTLNFTCTLHCS